MEFYVLYLSQCQSSKSFNSQRDGILPKALRYRSSLSLFQFPTGWNSTFTFGRPRYLKPVSIPNGMEFYSKVVVFCKLQKRFNSQRDGILLLRLLLLLFQRKFQFPTGWNSTVSAAYVLTAMASFNSQRDGILQIGTSFNTTVIIAFQFPTGWNSTDPHRMPLTHQTSVSIPNGMEFYLAISKVLRICLGFNSQRDGILLYRYVERLSEYLFQFPTGWNSTLPPPSFRALLPPVSIPNGMEFYALIGFGFGGEFLFQFPTGWNSTSFLKNTTRFGESFNSQRDGILLFCFIKSFADFSFQFPTGWNSTIGSLENPVEIWVSIPNGMEFYTTPAHKYIPSVCFNSQRDGILPGAVEPELSKLTRFQFPTGWNSTVAANSTFSISSRFNSQRDGILHQQRHRQGVHFGGFNSQRDGILLDLKFFGRTAEVVFQFPTGWNSTFLRKLRRPRARRFNSQRDGILLTCFYALYLSIIVSIPNGMEFYRATKPSPSSYSCFNSQRDGILRFSSTKYFLVFGFNSQRDGILLFTLSRCEEKAT